MQPDKRFVRDEDQLDRNNPHPIAIELIRGMTFAQARNKLRRLWAPRKTQDLIISQAKANNLIKQVD